MAISKEEAERIAGLARLQLSHEKIVRHQAGLSSILGHIDRTRQVGTSGIDSTAHYTSNEKTTGEDKTGVSLPVDDALADALTGVNNMFSVPKVIEN
jgi:aspartyl/glutamyl-tRNA(Asn/Gln) amidotransferase C subunit